MKPIRTLTGRTRHRTGWFGRMIYQVEEHVQHWCDDRGWSQGDYRWRDARVADHITGERQV